MNGFAMTAGQLRRELNARAAAYAREHRLLHEFAPGAEGGVVFGRDESGRHGNFHPAADYAIRNAAEWVRRLAKAHTASRRSVARKDWRWMELDAATSSDALLMNIFCHPGVYAPTTGAKGGGLTPGVAGLLGVDAQAALTFGALPGVPLKASPRKPRRRGTAEAADPGLGAGGLTDRTEVDLIFGPPDAPELLVEAKLTESDFQLAAPALAGRYRDLEAVFDVGRLPRRAVGRAVALAANVDPDDPTVNLPRTLTKERIVGYQLIRNVLAAYAAGCAFCVLLDARRQDLIEQWFAVLSAVHAPELRWRLKLLTWQELAAALPADLRAFLEARYGIRTR